MRTLRDRGLARGTVGLEEDALFLPIRAVRTLEAGLAGGGLVDAGALVEALRAVKSPPEIGYIRRAARAAEAGLRAALAVRASLLRVTGSTRATPARDRVFSRLSVRPRPPVECGGATDMPCPRRARVSDRLGHSRAHRLALGVAWVGLIVEIVSAGAASTLEMAEPPGPRAVRSSMRLGGLPGALAARDQAWQLWVGVSRNGGPTTWQPLETLPDRSRCEAALTTTLEERRKGYREIGVFELPPLGGEGFVRVDEDSLDVHTFRFRCTPAADEPGSQRQPESAVAKRGGQALLAV